MKLLLFATLGFWVFMLTNASYALTASDVAVIDYFTAVCLHPKMALYDCSRGGFYKVELGLSEDEFNASVSKLIENPPEDVVIEKNKIEKRLVEISKERTAFFEKQKNSLDFEKELNLLSEEEYRLKSELENVNWKFKNNDITDNKETKVVFEEIYEDINTAVDEVVKKHNYQLVFNSSIFYPYSTVPAFSESMLQGYNIPGLNSIFFYSLYNKKYSKDTKNSNELITDSIGNLYWDELTRDFDTKNEYDLFPYPMVLSGGNFITSEVMGIIYERYKVNVYSQDLISYVIMTLEALQNGKPVVEDRMNLIQEKK